MSPLRILQAIVTFPIWLSFFGIALVFGVLGLKLEFCQRACVFLVITGWKVSGFPDPDIDIG